MWPPEDYAGLARVRAVGVPIAAGENAAGLFAFKALFEAGALDIAQPSVTKIGGPSASLEIAALARAFGVRLVPHNATFGMGYLASLHINADGRAGCAVRAHLRRSGGQPAGRVAASRARPGAGAGRAWPRARSRSRGVAEIRGRGAGVAPSLTNGQDGAMPHPTSMTGFARTEGARDARAWVWELRSVNGRGLDLRFRLPPGLDALEPGLREAAGRVLKRGNVTASLTLRREEAGRLAPDPAALEQALRLALELRAASPRRRRSAPRRCSRCRACCARRTPSRPRRRSRYCARGSKRRWRNCWRRGATRARGSARCWERCSMRSRVCAIAPRRKRRDSRRRSGRGCSTRCARCWPRRRVCRRSASPRRSRCWRRVRTCARSWIG